MICDRFCGLLAVLVYKDFGLDHSAKGLLLSSINRNKILSHCFMNIIAGTVCRACAIRVSGTQI